MLTALDCAKQCFDAAISQGKQQVNNVALHRFIAERTGQSRITLNGTLDGTGDGSLLDAEWYTLHWYKQKLDNGRIVHCRHTGADITAQREMNYDSPTKRLVCQKIMGYLPEAGSPRLLTLASASGNCVQEAVKRNPNTRIYNVEKRPDVLNLWKLRKKQLGIDTTDYLCTFQDYLNAPGFADHHYAVVNADTMGYACEHMYTYLRVLNRARNADIVAITTQKLDAFRNHGAFQEALRRKYAGDHDAHAQCIADWMDNYEMVDRHWYKKGVGTRAMEVFIFQLAGAA